jgi:molybdate transport system ATP-binding protein
MSFTLANVSVKKNGLNVLTDISFSYQSPGNYLIAGPSGAGKSTFLDLIAGKIFPTQGKFTKDKDLKIVSVSRDYSFHRIVGSAYQYYQQRYNVYDAEVGPTLYEVLQNQVLPLHTVDKNSVDLPPLAYPETKVLELARKFKVDHLLDRKITSLSNGETRRSLLTFWMLKEPDILLLDNPFSGLDVESRAALKDILSQLKHTQVFLVAEKKDLPDGFKQALYFHEGKISYTGPVENLPEEENLRSIPDFEGLHTPLNSPFETALKLVNVQVMYGDKIALNKINWEVKAGECWAVLGPNGSGKSTLMSLLTADNPQAYRNEIYLFDKKRGSGESIWDIKKRIGFVSPELHLFFHKGTPVWKVIGSGFFDAMGLFKKLENGQAQLIDSYLERFGLSALKELRLDQLSTGQQRLVLLLRALVKNPQLLVLDEPCQGLDHNQMVFFRETLDKLVRSQKKTLIYITHYKEEIPSCVDKFLHLEEGVRVQKPLPAQEC